MAPISELPEEIPAGDGLGAGRLRSQPIPSQPRDVQLDVSDSGDHALVVSAARRLAREIGFGESDEFLIATAVSELSTNIVHYAGRGQITLRPVAAAGRSGIEVVALDAGPGIADVALALKDHYSTGGTLGLGLPSVQRIMDTLCVESRPGRGTICTARKWLD